jgi:hypothetical protein
MWFYQAFVVPWCSVNNFTSDGQRLKSKLVYFRGGQLEGIDLAS